MSPEIKNLPVSPVEAGELRKEQIPGGVFTVFNSLISQNLHRGRARVLQKDVLAQLEDQGMDRTTIFDRHWLDVEDSYREVGWKVEYDKPVSWGGENFEAYFQFSEINYHRR